MGLARLGQGAVRRRCRCPSLTTSNAEIARNTHAPFGFRRRGASAALALLDDIHRHRLRRAAWHLPPRRSERGPPLILGRAPTRRDTTPASRTGDKVFSSRHHTTRETCRSKDH
jgi:hypothetical protein